MTIQIALFLLTVCAAFTGLITEAIKKMFKVKKPTIVAAIVSVIVGIAVPLGYTLVCHLPFVYTDIVYYVAMVVLTWLSATLGFDKVMEIIRQLIPVQPVGESKEEQIEEKTEEQVEEPEKEEIKE